MNKIRLHQQLMAHLQTLLNSTKAAAEQAHETATNEENIAENKYDTLALEAAYLAQGQAERVKQCQSDIDLCTNLPLETTKVVKIGSLVALVDNDNQAKYLLICPAAGGIKLTWDQHVVLVVTPQSPIGSALLSQTIGDSVAITINNKGQEYEVLQII